MHVHFRPIAFILPLLFSCSTVRAQETIFFDNGFSLTADSHIQTGERIILRANGGTLEFSANEIVRIEPASESPEVPKADKLDSVKSPQDLLKSAAADQQLPPELVCSIAKAESGFRNDAVSAKGAVGLMQLMPSTAGEFGVDPARADQNAEGGAKYLRALLIRYHGDSALALAAYNAGPATVDKFGGVPPYAETRRYVLKVLREYERQHKPSCGSKRSNATE
jgi:hypothetical protein